MLQYKQEETINVLTVYFVAIIINGMLHVYNMEGYYG